MSDLVAMWWSYAEADTSLVGAVVVILGAAAAAVVASRAIARVRRRR